VKIHIECNADDTGRWKFLRRAVREVRLAQISLQEEKNRGRYDPAAALLVIAQVCANGASCG